MVQKQQSGQSSSTNRTLECGHSSERESVSLPGVGGVCRSCHTPIQLRKWEPTIRTTKTHHQTGETSFYRTWLLGLDEFGRAVYHDEYHGRILKLVPKHRREFKNDITGTEQIIRTYPPKHGGGRGRPINAPDNDVLVAAEQIDTPSRDFQKRDLVAWVTNQAHTHEWDALSDAMIELLEKYSKSNIRVETEHVDTVLEEYQSQDC